MHTQTVPSNPAVMTSNNEREVLKKLLSKRVEMVDRSANLCNEQIEILSKQNDIIQDRMVKQATDLVVECLPSELKKGMKSQPAIIKNVDRKKEEQELGKKIVSTKLVTSFYDRLDQTIASIVQPMQELLTFKIDDALHNFNEYTSKLYGLNLEKKANNAVSDLHTLLATLQRNPPAPNSPIDPEVGKAIAVADAHINNLVNCSRAMLNVFGKLEKVCSLREQVKQPSFDFQSIQVEEVKNEAIYCDKLRSEFLSLRDNPLNGFVAAWKSKIDALKITSDSIAKTRNDLIAKLTSIYRPTPSVKEEAKVVTSNSKLAMAR